MIFILFFCKARPYWDEEPVDVTKGVEENVTFSCKALGRPEPKVNWFINGEPFESKFVFYLKHSTNIC